MKINFTQLGIFLITLFTFSQISAQRVNTLRVDSPASIAGEYPFNLTEGWGLQLMTDLAGSATFVDDGVDLVTDACDGTITNVTGKIAFVDRNLCEFGFKALAAENAGAIAVMICNNEDGPILPAVGMDGGSVGIPVGGMLQSDCAIIRAIAEGADIEATLTFVEAPCPFPVYGSDVVWGNVSGQGDFANGLAGWIVSCEGDSCWGWSDDLNALSSASFGGGIIASPTACNGAMVFNQDWLDNAGNGIENGEVNTAAIGSGICPSDCIGSVTSPVIDLTGIPNLGGLFIEFYQQTRQLNSTYQIILSKNGGITWPDTVVVNPNIEVNSDFPVTGAIRVPAVGYENSNTITMQFRYVGDYYYWVIDDVRLVNESVVDMGARENFFSTAPSYRVPASQASEIPFLVDIENLGNVPALDVSVTVDIFNNGSNVFSSTNTNYADQPGGSFLNENSVFPETYTPELTGLYNGTYTVNTSGNDENPNNNTVPFSFEVTDDILSSLPSEDEIDLIGFLDGSVFIAPTNDFFTPNYATGYMFYLPNGNGHTLSNVRFGIQDLPSTTLGNIDIILYSIARSEVDAVGDLRIDLGADAVIEGVNAETIRTGGGQVRVGSTTLPAANNNAIDIAMVKAAPNGEPLLNNDNLTQSIDLANDRQYIIMFACRSGDDGSLPINLLGYGADNANVTDRNYLHIASNLAFDSLFIDRHSGTILENISATDSPEDINSLVIDRDVVGLGATGNFGTIYDFRELFVELTIVDRSVGTEDLNTDQAIDVFPNPATDNFIVELALENVSKAVTVEVVDAKGQRVITRSFDNVLNGKLEINTTSLVSGFYNVNVRTEAGLTSKKILIQK